MALASLVEVPAPAKLNLFLHVSGRRVDGYHLLDSLMVPIDWCDTLHFELRRDGELRRHDLGAALPAEDLCLRAARALRDAAAQQGAGVAGADISIEKRVPSGAGLGGGSSDAATVLLALNRLWRLDWPLTRLLPIGLALGADVPFFLGGTPARARGVGERLEPVAHAPARFGVVKPVQGLETRAVFASPRLAALLAGREQEPAARIAGFSERNDLEAAAEDLCPDVTRALALLRDAFGESRMSGSGSAVFAKLGADAAAGGLPPLPPGWQGRICRSLAEHPLRGWAPTEG